MVEFAPGKEQQFEADVLHFASDLYHSPRTAHWTCLIEHIQDPARWVDLFDIAQFAHMSPETWCDTDAFTTSWDEPTPDGFKHPGRPRRLKLAKLIGLNRFDPQIAVRAPKYDVLTFIFDPLQNWLANLLGIPTYSVYVICHEVAHLIEDWTQQALVKDGVHPWEDTGVVATLDAYIKHVGGWGAFRRLYLL